MCIYICCRVKTWSKNSFFSCQNFVQFVFVFFQNYSSFCRENEIKNWTKLEHINYHFWVKTWSNYVAQHTWTKFWLNLRPSFDSTFLAFGAIFPFRTYAETTIFIVFSAKNCILKAHPKKAWTLFVNNCATDFFCPFFLHVCFLGFLLCPFCGLSFWRGMKSQRSTRKQQQKKDHKTQTRRPLSLVTKKTHRNEIIQINYLKWKQTTQEKQTRTKT